MDKVHQSPTSNQFRCMKYKRKFYEAEDYLPYTTNTLAEVNHNTPTEDSSQPHNGTSRKMSPCNISQYGNSDAISEDKINMAPTSEKICPGSTDSLTPEPPSGDNLSVSTEDRTEDPQTSFLHALEAPQTTQEICMALLNIAFWRPDTSQRISTSPKTSTNSSDRTYIEETSMIHECVYHGHNAQVTSCTNNGDKPEDSVVLSVALVPENGNRHVQPSQSSFHQCAEHYHGKLVSDDNVSLQFCDAKTKDDTPTAGTQSPCQSPSVNNHNHRGQQTDTTKLEKSTSAQPDSSGTDQNQFSCTNGITSITTMKSQNQIDEQTSYAIHKETCLAMKDQSYNRIFSEPRFCEMRKINVSESAINDPASCSVVSNVNESEKNPTNTCIHPVTHSSYQKRSYIMAKGHTNIPLTDSQDEHDENSRRRNPSGESLKSDSTESTISISSLHSRSSSSPISFSNPESVTSQSTISMSSCCKGPSSLFPKPAKGRRLWEIVDIMSRRHEEDYFMNWTAEQVLDLPADERPNVFPVTHQVKKEYVSKSVMTENKKLAFCWISGESWGEEFREKLKQGQFRTLSEAKRDASRLWRDNCPQYDSSRAVRSRDTIGNIIMKRTRAQSGSEFEYRLGLKKAKVNQTMDQIWERRDIITNILRKNNFETTLQEINREMVDYTAPSGWYEQVADVIAYSLKKELLKS